MTSVTSFTSERMLTIENAAIVDAELDAGDLVLTTFGGSEINVGSVIGPVGDDGPTGPAGAGVTIGQLGQFPIAPPGGSGYLNCDGSTQLIATYPDLAAYLGTTFGGNGTTTFGLPSYSGQVLVGRDAGQTEFDTYGETGGAKTHTLTSAEIPAHTHPDTLAAPAHTHPMPHTHEPSGGGDFLDSTTGAPVAGTSGGIGGGLSASTGQPSTANTGAASATALTGGVSNNTGGGGAHNNLQPYRVVFIGIYAGV